MTRIAYCATDPKVAKRWVTPLFMPRWASRITLKITNLRVEHLHAITEADAEAEGVAHFLFRLPINDLNRVVNVSNTIVAKHGWGSSPTDARAAFGALWHEINGEVSWDANPWVWVVEFAVMDGAAL